MFFCDLLKIISIFFEREIKCWRTWGDHRRRTQRSWQWYSSERGKERKCWQSWKVRRRKTEKTWQWYWCKTGKERKCWRSWRGRIRKDEECRARNHYFHVVVFTILQSIIISFLPLKQLNWTCNTLNKAISSPRYPAISHSRNTSLLFQWKAGGVSFVKYRKYKESSWRCSFVVLLAFSYAILIKLIQE